MAKQVHDTVLDGAFDIIKNNVTTMLLCSGGGAPADRAAALSAALADVAVTGTDLTHADDTSGRKTTIAAKNGVTVDTGGTGTHVCLISASVLLYVTTCTSKVVAASDQVNFPAWKINIQDPT